MFEACFATIRAHSAPTARNSQAGAPCTTSPRGTSPTATTDPSAALPVTLEISHQRPTASGARRGCTTTRTPDPVATPLPPRKCRVTGNMWPTTAAAPHQYAMGTPSTTSPSPAARAPLPASSTYTHTPVRQPSARVTLEAPGFPEPNVEMRMPLGNVPSRYAIGTRNHMGEWPPGSAPADADRHPFGRRTGRLRVIHHRPRALLDRGGEHGGFAVTADALGVGPVERDPDEELGGHAAALAGVVGPARGAGAGRLRLAQFGEELALLPDAGEDPVGTDRTGLELVVDHERTGVDVADRVDEAHHTAGTTHVEPRQRAGSVLDADRIEVEERVAGEHVVAVREQPLVDLTLLGVGGMQFVPGVGATTRWTQPRDAQLGAVGVGQSLELVELVDVVAGDDHPDLELAEAGIAQVLPRPDRRGVRAGAAYGVVGDGVGSVEADLDVEVVHGRQPAGLLGVDERTVGGELDADAALDRVLEELEEVTPDHRFAPADVDVEHLEVVQFVEHGLGLVGGELARVAASRRRQAVDALEVAGVGEFPREADRGIETALELFDQVGGPAAHRTAPTRSISDSVSDCSARSNDGQRRSSMSQARNVSARVAVPSRRRTTDTTSGCFRKISLRLP